jgi:predicted ferric reductase
MHGSPPEESRFAARLAGERAVWRAVYVAFIAAPLLLLLCRPGPPGLGFRWDLGIACGFAGFTLMSVQFLLTGRFQRATAPFGIDIVYYFHRYLAVVALAFVVAHPALLIADNPALAEYLDPSRAPRHMAAGTVALGALMLLMLTSLARTQLHIPYEAWRIAHLVLSIAAVALTFLHVIGVSYYTSDPWTRALWAAVGLSLVGTVGYVRLVRPWALSRRPYRVADLVEERGDAWTMTLRPDGHDGFRFEPGQFVWLTLRSSPYRMQEHPFSISSSATDVDGRIAVTIKELGDFTNTIRNVRNGERAYVDGPYGAFTIDRHPAAAYVFLAGGIGIAPIMSMLRTLAERGDRRPLLLFYAYRRWERMTFRDDLAALAGRLDLRIVYILEDPPTEWQGERGRITRELLDRHLFADREGPAYFVCGPEAMIRYVERLLDELDVPATRVHSELFDLV